MPARSVIRPTLANRFSSTPASNPATITQSQSSQGVSSAAAPNPNGPVAASRGTPQGFQGTGFNQSIPIPAPKPTTTNLDFIVPNGAKGIVQITPNGVKITNNPQYTEPITLNGKIVGTGIFDTAIVGGKLTSNIIGFKGTPQTQSLSGSSNTSAGNLTESGKLTYTYALLGNSLVPKITSETGGIFYQSPMQAQEYAQAQAAHAAAESNISTYNSIKTNIIPGLLKQMNTSYQASRNLTPELEDYNAYMNSLMGSPIYNSGPFAGYNAGGLAQHSATVMHWNAPTEVAELTTSGLKPLSVTVSNAIYGNISGKNQLLGTIELVPKVSNGALSLSYAGFNPSVVQVSGPGWEAGLNSSYNPTTKQISINPSNYAYVTGNLQVSRSGPETISTITMPSGFGLSETFGEGALNYTHITGIPIANSKYSATESYTKTGTAPAQYSLTNAGTFPFKDTTIVSLGKGITEDFSENRNFNPLTGAITYTGSNTFAIPQIGSLPVPSTGSLSEDYTYKGNKYTFAYNPTSLTYSITGAPQSSILLTPTKSSWSAPEVWPSTSSSAIAYNINSLGSITGFSITNSAGSVIGGADYITPKGVGVSNVQQPTLINNMLILPTKDYASYSKSINANMDALIAQQTLSAESNQYSLAITTVNSRLPFLPFRTILNPLEKAWDPFLWEYQGGTLVHLGEPVLGLEMALVGLAEGEAPVFIISAPVAALTGATISTSAQAATNVLTGKPITNNLVLAGSLGADIGGFFGATMPADLSAGQVAGRVAVNAVKIGAITGGYDVAGSLAGLAFGGASQTSGSSNKGSPQISGRSQSGAKSQSSSSLLGNYSLSTYLNTAVDSFAQGFTYGTEFAGAYGAAGEILGNAVASGSTTAKILSGVLSSKPISSGLMAATGFGGTLASGGTFRQALVSGASMGIFTYGFMGLGEELNPQLKGTSNQATIVEIRQGPDEGGGSFGSGKGTLITGIKDYNNIVLSSSQVEDISNAALKANFDNLQSSSNAISKALYAPKTITYVPTTTPITGEAWGKYFPDSSTPVIQINPELPNENMAEVLIHENLHNFFENGNSDIVRSYRLTPATAKSLNAGGYAGVDSLSIFKEEATTFALTPHILNGRADIYMDQKGEFTNIGFSERGVAQNANYRSVENKFVTAETDFKNGYRLTEGTGVARVLTGENTGAVGEQTAILKGMEKVETTTSVNTKLRDLLSIGPKKIVTTSFKPIPESLSSIFNEDPLAVINQPGGIESNPDLSDVYKTSGIRPSGTTTIFRQSISTPQGEEWLSVQGRAEDFQFKGQTKDFLTIVKSPGQAFDSTADMLKGRPGQMKSSPYEGPKPSTPTKPFDLGLEEAMPSPMTNVKEPVIESPSQGETQVQAQKQVPKTLIASASNLIDFSEPLAPTVSAFAINAAPAAISNLALGSNGSKTIYEPLINTKLTSIVGLDPYALASQPTTTMLISGMFNTQRQSAITSINRQSNLNPLSNMLKSSSRTNLLFGSYIGLSNKSIVSQKQSQSQKQKQTQNQIQKNAYKNPPPTISAPPIPNYLYAAIAPPNRIKPAKKQAKKGPATPKGTFHYINDLTSAIFNLHGNKKSKASGLGFFRPL